VIGRVRRGATDEEESQVLERGLLGRGIELPGFAKPEVDYSLDSQDRRFTVLRLRIEPDPQRGGRVGGFLRLRIRLDGRFRVQLGHAIDHRLNQFVAHAGQFQLLLHVRRDIEQRGTRTDIREDLLDGDTAHEHTHHVLGEHRGAVLRGGEARGHGQQRE